MIPAVILAPVIVMIVIVIVASAAVALTRKIPIPRRIARKRKKLTLKRNIFIRCINIKENRIMTNTSTLIKK